MDRRSFIKNTVVTGVAAVGLTRLGPAGSGCADGPSTVASGSLPIRPPGALAEQAFLSRCIRCLRCSDACPNHAIVPLERGYVPGSEGTPHIKPRRQTCMLCNGVEGEYLKCTEACPSGSLERVRRDPEEILSMVELGIAEIDLALCYSYNSWSCGACYRACPFPGVAMTLGLWERPEVVASACIGCGMCERACIRYPQAIRVRPRGVA